MRHKVISFVHLLWKRKALFHNILDYRAVFAFCIIYHYFLIIYFIFLIILKDTKWMRLFKKTTSQSSFIYPNTTEDWTNDYYWTWNFFLLNYLHCVCIVYTVHLYTWIDWLYFGVIIYSHFSINFYEIEKAIYFWCMLKSNYLPT